MKAYFIHIFLYCILLLLSCKKDKPSEMVVVQGRIWDDNMQRPVTNLLVYIYDVKCENFACHSNEIVDSTRTDYNGNYKMNYERKNYNTLYVKCSYPRRSYVPATSQDNEYQILKSGNYTKDFTLRKTIVLKTRVQISNNLYPPLKIFDNIEAHMEEIRGVNNDTTIYLRAVANRSNTIDMVAHSPDMKYYRRKTEVIDLKGYADTFKITILADPESFPIKKY